MRRISKGAAKPRAALRPTFATSRRIVAGPGVVGIRSVFFGGVGWRIVNLGMDRRCLARFRIVGRLVAGGRTAVLRLGRVGPLLAVLAVLPAASTAARTPIAVALLSPAAIVVAAR